uniref:Uncharacterized protein n=1 Tax=Pseudo-nitzschia arenysensis TaxID=697910 RepID=A0A7R9ZUE7_9STRA|mmetsp:Transcript_914/g.2120  ORF Transcript_914/g.2120 Transcript_914/m.2120 type:complete len:236 (+) Transcript_914:233-940(+)
MKNKIEPTVAAVPVVSTPAMVQVTAPSSLEAGYTFDAVYNGEVFPVTVPTGGVQAGQTFAVPFVPVVEAVAVPIDDESPQQQHDESTPILPTLSPTRNANRNSPQAPLGTWKTSWYDCLSEGLCHPSLLNAYFFPQILMGQVLTRMKLNWCGYPIGGESYKYTTYIWIFLTVFLIFQKLRFSDCLGEVSNNVWYDPLQIFADDDDDDDDEEESSEEGGDDNTTPSQSSIARISTV